MGALSGFLQGGGLNAGGGRQCSNDGRRAMKKSNQRLKYIDTVEIYGGGRQEGQMLAVSIQQGSAGCSIIATIHRSGTGESAQGLDDGGCCDWLGA